MNPKLIVINFEHIFFIKSTTSWLDVDFQIISPHHFNLLQRHQQKPVYYLFSIILYWKGN